MTILYPGTLQLDILTIADTVGQFVIRFIKQNHTR